MILLDKEIISVDDFKERVMIVGEDIYELGFRDQDHRMFEVLGVEPVDEYGDEMPIEKFVDKVGKAFFDFLDFVGYGDCESCGNIKECEGLNKCVNEYEDIRDLFFRRLDNKTE